MTFQFRPAVRENTKIILGIGGPSGSGKTFSALRVARGLAGPNGKVCMIDTEGRRGLHYADQFQYDYAELGAPFTSERYIEAIAAAVAAGAAVVVTDSMSHEHDGAGGMLEQHELELLRMAGQDAAKRERANFTAWIKPKAAHNRFVQTVLQTDAHMIFAFRAKEKLKLVRNQRGKIEPVPIGWQPICSTSFEYEMTALLMLPPGAQGKPGLDEPACKLQEQHRGMFRADQPLSEATGEALAKWAAGGAKVPARNQASPGNGARTAEIITAEAWQIASLGTERLRQYWNSLSARDRVVLEEIKDELKLTAKDIDENPPPAKQSGLDFDEGTAIATDASSPEQPASEPAFDADGVILDTAGEPVNPLV